MEYQKIQTLFKRDENGMIIPTEYTLPEFEALDNCMWECTEKIDGTNIRIELEFSGGMCFTGFAGRTDNAQIPKHLERRLHELFDSTDWMSAFPSVAGTGGSVTLYGEGYGAKIQKGGGNYIRNGVDFILFDVKVGNWWLGLNDVHDVARKLGIRAVPFMGFMTLAEATDLVRMGFTSAIAENESFPAEGVVLKAPYGLLRRNGERLITKIKTKDFRDLERRGGHEAVETEGVPEGA